MISFDVDVRSDEVVLGNSSDYPLVVRSPYRSLCETVTETRTRVQTAESKSAERVQLYRIECSNRRSHTCPSAVADERKLDRPPRMLDRLLSMGGSVTDGSTAARVGT